MKELVTMAFHKVRGIQEIYIPEVCSAVVLNIIENLGEVAMARGADEVIIEGGSRSFYLRFYNDTWVGVITDTGVNEVLIRAALERAHRFLEKHQQVKKRIAHIEREIEEHFKSLGIVTVVRGVSLSLGSDTLSGVIQLAVRGGKLDTIKEQMGQFLNTLLPYFIKNKVSVTIERESFLDRISRDQVLKIIRRVERL